MTPTQQNILDAEQYHRSAVEQLDILRDNLVRRERRMMNAKSLYMEEWNGVTQMRERIRQMESVVKLASHKCLELQAAGERGDAA